MALSVIEAQTANGRLSLPEHFGACLGANSYIDRKALYAVSFYSFPVMLWPC